MENPKSGDVAAIFMVEGKANMTGDHSDAFPIEVCNPQNAMVPGWDLEGCTPEGVNYDYDMKPMRLNPRSVAGQNPPADAQGHKK